MNLLFKKGGFKFKTLKSAVLENSESVDSVRSIFWFIFFNKGLLFKKKNAHVTLLDVYKTVYKRNRAEYRNLRSAFELAAKLDEQNSKLTDRIKSEKLSMIKRFEEEQREVIRMDVDRTLPETDLFRQGHIKEMMIRILTIYFQNNIAVYKQGMHEILAILIYVIRQDHRYYGESKKETLLNSAYPKTRSESTGSLLSPTDTLNKEIIRKIFDKDHEEADAYFLFSSVVPIIWDLYDLGEMDREIIEIKNNAIISKNKKLKVKSDDPPRRGSRKKFQPPTANTSIAICAHIQNVLLKSLDRKVYKTLYNLRIEPQIYLIRWTRMLLSREFKLDVVPVIWDYLFVEDLPEEFLQYVAVSMLIRIRGAIVGKNDLSVLTELFKYRSSSRKDVMGILRAARILRYEKDPLPKAIKIFEQEEQEKRKIFVVNRDIEINEDDDDLNVKCSKLLTPLISEIEAAMRDGKPTSMTVLTKLKMINDLLSGRIDFAIYKEAFKNDNEESDTD